MCPVCLADDDDAAGAPALALDCRHRFHTACITEWLACGNLSCPVCRAPPSSPQLRVAYVDDAAAVPAHLLRVRLPLSAAPPSTGAVLMTSDADLALWQPPLLPGAPSRGLEHRMRGRALMTAAVAQRGEEEVDPEVLARLEDWLQYEEEYMQHIEDAALEHEMSRREEQEIEYELSLRAQEHHAINYGEINVY